MNTSKNTSTSHRFAIKLELDRCFGSCNTINDLSNKVCVPNKPEDLNLSLFNMIIGISESKALTKYVSYKCICRSDGRNCKSDQRWNIDKYQYECKKSHVSEKDYVWNSTICNCGKYSAIIMDDPAIICDEVIDADDKTKTSPTNFNEKKVTCQTQNFYILIAFLLITIAHL